jgi:hypothetical protein
MVEQLITDLEAIRAGQLSEEQFRQRYGTCDVSGDLEAIICNLEHYFGDADIRERDADYRHFQDKELDKLITHLRSGQINRAVDVNFLYVSPA